MSGAGFFQLVVLCVVLGGHGDPARALHGRRLRRAGRRLGAGRPLLRPDRAGRLPHPARRPAARAALERLRHRPAGVQLRVVPVVYALQRFQGSLPFNPTNMAGGRPARRVQRRRQLHDEHELAVVQRRADDEPPDPDGRAWRCRTSCRPPPAWRSPSRSSAASARRGRRTLGNFWVDLDPHDAAHPAAAVVRRRHRCCRSAASSRTSRVITEATPVDAGRRRRGRAQSIPGGPVASQIAIKQLGTNGGGFFNTNSAHPFENPTGDHRTSSRCGRSWSSRSPSWSRTACMVGSKKQARVLLAVMAGIWLAMSVLTIVAEGSGNPSLTALGVDQGSVERNSSAATSRARRSASDRRRAGCGRRRRPARRTGPSTACTTASRRSAGCSRCCT